MARAPRNLNYLNQKQCGLVKSTMETIRFNNENNLESTIKTMRGNNESNKHPMARAPRNPNYLN